MLNICLKKSKTKNLFRIVFQDKHKIKENLGYYNQNNNNILINKARFFLLMNNGVKLSKTLFYVLNNNYFDNNIIS